jgi:polyferredoxin
MKLKQLRVVLALIVFSLLTFFMIDFSGSIPEKYMFLTRVQLVPALLAGSLVILAGLFILTLLLGRLYCSVLCPIGIYQDIITWLRKRFKPRMRQRYTREKKWLRLTVLAAVIIGYFGGWTMLLSLLDPYSGYSRMAAHLFKPVWQEGNNLLAAGLNRMDNYSLYKVPVLLFDVTSFLIALLTIGVVSLLAILYGRSWCNTVCPVGTVLGYVSKFSLFKMHIDPVACNECGLCELTCKSSCLDSSRQYIDAS